MSTELPDVVRHFFDAANRDDAAAVARAFTTDAIVLDEGREVTGHDAIAAWFRSSSAAVQARIRVEEVLPRATGLVVRSQVSGDFPGSPVKLDFCFTTRDGAIARLEIEA